MAGALAKTLARQSNGVAERLKQGYADAQHTLGWRYQYVKGVNAQNYVEAIKWYGKAAEKGHADAQANLSELSARVARSQQIDVDGVKAVRLNYRTAEQIGFGGTQPIRRGFGRNNVRTFLHYQRAAQQGDTTAQNNIGVMYANGIRVDKDHEEAINWFSQAAQQGDTTAQNSIGVMYANGIGVDKDYGQGVSLVSIKRPETRDMPRHSITSV